MGAFLKVAVVFFISSILSIAHAEAQNDEMKNALRRLVISQKLERNWPMMVENAALSAVKGVQQGALDALAKRENLSIETTAKAKEIITELSPQIAKEIADYHLSLDAVSMMQDMVEAIYPKYFSLSEIVYMTNFYESSAFQKTVNIGLMVGKEHARTGEAKDAVWARYSGKYTEQEKKFMDDFRNSNLGKKQVLMADRLKADCMKFLDDRFKQGSDKIVLKYAEVFARKLREER